MGVLLLGLRNHPNNVMHAIRIDSKFELLNLPDWWLLAHHSNVDSLPKLNQS